MLHYTQKRYFFTTACFICLFLAFMLPSGKSLAANLFDTKELKSSRLTSFPKWTTAMQRYVSTSLKDGDCDSNIFNKCHQKKWQHFVGSLKSKSTYSQLKNINNFINNAPYIIDPINWNVPDYWATPYQFFQKDGDCEDYAIAKFMSLRKLGYTNEQMRIVILNDENLNVIHAVLAVYADNRIFILDNQISQVLEDKSIHHYSPIYSINETSWWRHI